MSIFWFHTEQDLCLRPVPAMLWAQHGSACLSCLREEVRSPGSPGDLGRSWGWGQDTGNARVTALGSAP